MRIKIVADGRVFTGTPSQIVQAMQSIAFGQETRTMSEYIDWLVDQAQRMNDIQLVVEGESDSERARSLVAAMLDWGLAEAI